MKRNYGFYSKECSKAVLEYRAKASTFRGNDILRRCYTELAWKKRRQAREYALLAA